MQNIEKLNLEPVIAWRHLPICYKFLNLHKLFEYNKIITRFFFKLLMAVEIDLDTKTIMSEHASRKIYGSYEICVIFNLYFKSLVTERNLKFVVVIVYYQDQHTRQFLPW